MRFDHSNTIEHDAFMDEREQARYEINCIYSDMPQSMWSVLKDLNEEHAGGFGGLRHALMMLGHHESVDVLDRYESMTVMAALERRLRTADQVALRCGYTSYPNDMD